MENQNDGEKAREKITSFFVSRECTEIAAAVRADSICVYCGPRSAAGFYVLWNASLVGLVQGSPNVH